MTSELLTSMIELDEMLPDCGVDCIEATPGVVEYPLHEVMYHIERGTLVVISRGRLREIIDALGSR